ncbi:hypothetical protein EMPG_10676 [Blastomyces silverae]|uniref:FAR-17a/AIG1-like protein n=1 Tax=Blastomyces silverae TaxID=2060906 RepID=A0A0H1B396_9EURO|nr:hypothetical protein EMPG_10676 [Blastomyces silverae]
MRSISALMGADPAHDSLHHFETSWLFRPVLFGILRLTIFFYCLLTIIITFALESARGNGLDNGRFFSYFTSLSFLGVLFYFLVAGIHTLLYARQGRSVLLDKWPRWLRALHSLFYTTIVCFPFVVMAIYWALLYKEGSVQPQFQVWGNISKHVLPAVFALFEIIFSTAPPPPLLHFPFLIIILLLYLGVAYITHAAQGFWVYPFLNPGPHGSRRGNVVKYLFIIVAALLVVFAVVWVVSWIRRRLVGLKTKWAKGAVEEWDVRGGSGRDGRDAEMGENAVEVYVDERK